MSIYARQCSRHVPATVIVLRSYFSATGFILSALLCLLVDVYSQISAWVADLYTRVF